MWPERGTRGERVGGDSAGDVGWAMGRRVLS